MFSEEQDIFFDSPKKTPLTFSRKSIIKIGIGKLRYVTLLSPKSAADPPPQKTHTFHCSHCAYFQQKVSFQLYFKLFDFANARARARAPREGRIREVAFAKSLANEQEQCYASSSSSSMKGRNEILNQFFWKKVVCEFYKRPGKMFSLLAYFYMTSNNASEPSRKQKL